MMQIRVRSTCLYALLMASVAAPAMGDVTAEDVWQNWQSASAAMGQTTVAGSVTRDGDTLVIGAITIASAGNGITAEGNIDQILMQDQGDGTVLVTMSPDYPLKMRLPAANTGQPEVELNILVTQTDLRIVASGSPADVSYDVTAPSVKLKLERIAGTDAQKANLTVDATMADIVGTFSNATTDAGLQSDSDITASGLAMAIVGADATRQSEFRATISMTDLAMKSSGALFDAVLAAGGVPELLSELDRSTDFSSQTSEFALEVDAPRGATRISGTTGAGQLATTISDGSMDYTASQNTIAVIVNAPTIPVPDLVIDLEKFAFGLKSPIAPSDDAKPFALTLNLDNLALSDAIWALFDPTAALPRDPINLLIDTEGTTKLTALPKDLNAPPMMPADLETLTLNTLRLDVAGAALTGSGTSTFAPDPSGIPSPNAKLDFTLMGANALMDKLVASGLIGPEMLTFPRMMLAMVASPMADGSDGYTSTIEIQDKAVSANGQVLYQLP